VSGGELLLLLVIALLVLGAHRLPEAGRLVGKGLRDFSARSTMRAMRSRRGRSSRARQKVRARDG